MRANRIEAVALLTTGSDAELIKEATLLFEQQASGLFQSLEVWDINRFVFRWPPWAEP